MISFLLFCLSISQADAVGPYRPACESEHGAADSRKDDLDKCIAKFESEHKGEEKDVIQALPEKDLPCIAELRALIIAQENLSQCMEKKMWWKPKKKK